MKKFTSAFGRLFLSAVLIFLVFYTMMPERTQQFLKRYGG